MSEWSDISGFSREIVGNLDPMLDGVEAPLGTTYVSLLSDGQIGHYIKFGHSPFEWKKISDADDNGFLAINGDAVPLIPGMLVATTYTDGIVRRAWAGSQAQAAILGMVVQGADINLPIRVKSDGTITFSEEQWDLVTGQLGGLTSGARYYLDAVSWGLLTMTPPIAPNCLAPIGRAVSSNQLVLRIAPFILQ